MQAADPTLSLKMQSAFANIVFPKVGQGGFILGGEWGRGVVFRNGQVIGYASLKAASVGLQAGGQSFDELVLVENGAALDRLVNQGLSFTSQAEGTILKSGAAAQTNFRDGTAVLIKPVGGMMANLSIGGQSISFVTTQDAQSKGW
jgi:lipid-binding SYLF domain-containing protein